MAELRNLMFAGIDAADWVEHPEPADITFVPEMQNDDNGLRVGRLFVPRDDSWDRTALQLLTVSPRGPHHYALQAIATSDEGKNRTAIQHYFASPYRGTVFGALGDKKFVSRVLALDWIKWESEEQFEQAAALVTGRVFGKGNPFENGGYWNNDTHPQANAMGWECLLVAICHGRPGPSGQWAAERLTHLGEPPSAESPLYSPYHTANVLTIQSRGGGGRENGVGVPNTIGGYEDYFITGGLIMRGWDTATGSRLLNNNLYFRTRAQGFALQRDTNVEKARIGDNIALRTMAMAAAVTGNAELAWMVRFGAIYRHDGLEFQACAGELPEPVPPASVQHAKPVAGKAGETWHYHSDPVAPNEAFRVAITCRDLSHYRLENADRTFGVAVGGVGLVCGGHYYRGQRQPAYANGISILHDGKQLLQKRPYWDKRASLPDEVASDPYHLVQTSQPTWNGATAEWVWEQDWRELLHHGGRLHTLKTTWTLDPGARELVIHDTIEHDGSLDVRLHFSPNKPVTIADNAFAVIDGMDSVSVSVACQRELTWRQSTVDASNKYSVGRVAEIVTAQVVQATNVVEFVTTVKGTGALVEPEPIPEPTPEPTPDPEPIPEPEPTAWVPEGSVVFHNAAGEPQFRLRLDRPSIT